ncbi:hypothetical protein CFC21_096107 [Triticum aestivum]|uniref:Uncharacterized protein n=3 Tax=Triticum TaxID=4564 RepID=A0A9R0Z4U5_TRITD|nr:hypothetical protein CFC21_096107 [Triticum aestivum]VAI70418.1 unnamed protein product [Triticum turgidum subsp. durum]
MVDLELDHSTAHDGHALPNHGSDVVGPPSAEYMIYTKLVFILLEMLQLLETLNLRFIEISKYQFEIHRDKEILFDHQPLLFRNFEWRTSWYGERQADDRTSFVKLGNATNLNAKIIQEANRTTTLTRNHEANDPRQLDVLAFILYN